MKNEEKFQPFVSADKKIPEITNTSIILGVILACVFGAANAYLGLRVGMTVSASIPAAVISMGVIRIILKKESILENNIVQTIGSAGESVAAGAIFTLPTLFMWQNEWGIGSASLFNITIISLCGGVLGVLFMVPLRKALIVKEHKNLPYPEGTACAEVLIAGEKKGKGAIAVFSGLGISSIYKFFTEGIKIFPAQIHFEFNKFKGGAFGIDVLPALLGVGYICGAKIASYMFAGGILSWLVIMPLINIFGGDAVLFPANEIISNMTSNEIWSNYIRYIGAGAVATGGIISLIKTMPIIFKTLVQTFKSVGGGEFEKSYERTERDISIKVIGITIFLLILIIWLVPSVPVNFTGAVIITLFSFFFAAVSSRLVGLVGSSNNPVSGMAIATLLIAAVILKGTGIMGREGMISAIAIGSVICIVGAVAGDTSQDLKTGFLLGATPKKQQIGEFIGIIVSALIIGGVLYLLDKAWGYGSGELPAPQATLMKMVVEGVMDGNLPWNLVISGAMIAVAVEVLKIPVLPFAVGLYLPIHLSATIMIGGIIRLIFEKRKENEKFGSEVVEKGILYSSGLIAGEGLVGILLAVFAVIPFGKSSFGEFINISDVLGMGTIGSVVFFGLLCGSFFFFFKKRA